MLHLARRLWAVSTLFPTTSSTGGFRDSSFFTLAGRTRPSGSGHGLSPFGLVLINKRGANSAALLHRDSTDAISRRAVLDKILKPSLPFVAAISFRRNMAAAAAASGNGGAGEKPDITPQTNKRYDTKVDPPLSAALLPNLDGVLHFVTSTGIFAVTFISLALGWLYLNQDSMLYLPDIAGVPREVSSNPPQYKSPAEYGIPFETYRIRCVDGVAIHSWLLLHNDSKSKNLPTIVYFHGNAGNMGFRLPEAVQMYQHLKANIFMVEYRGYGDSDDARPNEKGLKLDGEASLEFLSKHPQIDPSRIFLFGQSIGGALGFHLAQFAEEKNIPLAGVIVENTFVSIPRMVDHLMPYIAPLKSLILRIGWDSGKIVPNIRIPVLYLAGDSDEIVPHSQMLELFEASSKVSRCARIHVVKGAQHNDTFLRGGKVYMNSIRRFINDN